MEKFDNYCRAMKNKVERQRAERQRYNEELQERLRAQEELVSTLQSNCLVDFRANIIPTGKMIYMF